MLIWDGKNVKNLQSMKTPSSMSQNVNWLLRPIFNLRAFAQVNL